MMNLVRKRALKIINKAKNVKINKDKIKEFARQDLVVPEWPEYFHFKSLDYFFILDSINFCFWPIGAERWKIKYNNKEYNGYFALSLALKKFFEDNNPDLEYFSNIPQKEFYDILQGGKNLQFLNKRWHIVREVAGKIVKKYGTAENLVKSADKKLSNLVPKIEKLPYFKDYFLKRAQILPCDIFGAGLADFDGLDYLTAFADYKVPQILNYIGILEYSESLDRKISNKELIAKDSKQEKEIRAATIWAVELLRKELKNKFYSFEIDWILWNKAQSLNIKKPYHLTKTTNY